ncbi:MAG: type VI secretion system baseplate subunit TssE [Pseudomonadota bacterium]
MRYAPSLFDKLFQPPASDKRHELPGLSLEELKDSVAADLEALLNTRSPLDAATQIAFPYTARSVMNYGVADFSSRSLSSGLDRDFICQAIQHTIETQERRLRSVAVSIDDGQRGFNRLSFTIRATLLVSDVGEQVSFDARFEPTVQRYSVSNQRLARR